MKSQYHTFAEMEALLLTAICLPGSSVKDISAATGIKPSTLYKWKTSGVHLSPQKADTLLTYFIQNEPERLSKAELLISNDIYSIKNTSALLSEIRGGAMEV